MYATIVRWAFDRFYRELAWTYDRVAAAVSWGNWEAWALSVLPQLDGDVLELGCGTGNLQRTMQAKQWGGQLVGLDRSRQMLELTRHKAPAAVLLLADAAQLPFLDCVYDRVVATFPSEYIANRATLREIRRVLRPGGRLVIVLGAQLAGPRFYRWFVALAYRLTLQTPTPESVKAQPSSSAIALCRAIATAGFRTEDRWIPVSDGYVYMIIADRLDTISALA